MNRRSDEQLVALICAELDRQAGSLTPDLILRLDQIREQALRQPSLARGIEEQALVDRARDSLDKDSDITPEITARLDQIRGAALARMPATSAPNQPGIGPRLRDTFARLVPYWQLPAGMVATGLVLVTAISLFQPGTTIETLTADQELALLASVEDIELYENLEFYLWLADSGFATQ